MDTFASDGEGYTLMVRRLEHSAFNEARPYYAFMNERPNAEVTGLGRNRSNDER